jgi:hypothetical protein
LTHPVTTTSSPIFRDREKLSPRYIPPRLPHREGQTQELSDLFRDAAVDPLLRRIQAGLYDRAEKKEKGEAA